MKRSIVPIVAGLLGLAATAQAVEILHWQRLPLAVPLVVGQERVIFIDRNVRVGLPPTVGEHLRVQSAGGAIYLRASDPLPPTRLQLQDANSGALILLDVDAQPAKSGEPPLEPVRIVVDDPVLSHADNASDVAANPDEFASVPKPPTALHDTPMAVVLTRYAAQNLYAPLRTVEPVAGITRVNLHRDLVLNSLLPTLPVQARALAAWRLDDHWVTAIQLTNSSKHYLDLDPRLLQGDFAAATFQHANIGPASQSTDTTVVYLITRGHDLRESLLPTVAPIDPAVNLPAATDTVGQGGHDAQ